MDPKIQADMQGTQNSQNNLDVEWKKKKSRALTCPCAITYY